MTGAHLVDGAHLTLDGGSISGGGANCRTSAVGADLQENSRLVAKNAATFKDIAGNALRLNETSRATLTNASIDRDFSGLNLCATLPSIASFAASGVTLTNAKLLSKSVGPGNDVGVDFHTGGSFTVSGTTFTGHSTAAVRAFDKLKMTVSGSTFTGNLVGIHARDAGTISLTITGTTMSQNLVGILARSLKLRNSTFTFNSIGVGISGSSANLGTLADPGNNTFTGNNQSGVQFFDDQVTVSSGTMPEPRRGGSELQASAE